MKFMDLRSLIFFLKISGKLLYAKNTSHSMLYGKEYIYAKIHQIWKYYAKPKVLCSVKMKYEANMRPH